MVVFTRDALAAHSERHGWSVGEFSYGAPAVSSWGNDGRLTIGRYCSIARGVNILLGGNHRTDWVTTYPFSVLDPKAAHIKGHPHTRGDVVIGNDVWIGQNSVIVSGVKIGDGACIAASSVVARDVPPYTIAGGNPAGVLRKRFTDQQIEQLLEIRWWDRDPEWIRQRYKSLLSGDVDRFIASARDE